MLSGVSIILYVFFPLISWHIYFAPAFADQQISAPIPKNRIVSNSTVTVQSLVNGASNSIAGIDYTNALNWFPNYKYKQQSDEEIKVKFYTISIPAIKIKNAKVSTTNVDLVNNLVNYGGTAIPFNKGNAVVFGHSTLPQLFNEKDYKTMFTNLYKLEPGDEIFVTVDKKTYTYKIESVTVVDPENTTVLEQNYEDSFLTLVTCTPPGTIWKRLIVKSRIQKV